MQYKFKKPFKFGNETIETVELKEEFTMGDMIRITNAQGKGDQSGAMVVAATGWPLPKVAQIPMVDAVAIVEKVSSFFDLDQEEDSMT